jgi:hypothetical protein
MIRVNWHLTPKICFYIERILCGKEKSITVPGWDNIKPYNGPKIS